MPVLNAAYNYPGRTQTRCPWDLFFDVSFIYWQPIQENMELGIVDTIAPGATTSINGGVVEMDFDYKPGFKIGGGYYFEYDNWDVHGEYTWFHTSNSRSVAVNATASSAQRIYPMWGHPNFTGASAYDSASEKWTMNMDLVDLDLGRWYYVGTKLLFHPYIGARGAFIRQNAHVTYTSDSPFPYSTSPFRIADIFGKSHSWAVGPRAGLDTTWNVGEGFRVFGCGEADILYTRYTRLTFNSHSVAQAPSTSAIAGVYVTEKNVPRLRTHLDLELGLGWGTYWDCNNWYTDVALGYEFQVFFDQNMFRHFNSATMLGNSTQPNGNLYIQGLTATFSLTF